jgi:hypothetical protein
MFWERVDELRWRTNMPIASTMPNTSVTNSPSINNKAAISNPVLMTVPAARPSARKIRKLELRALLPGRHHSNI